MKNRRIPLAFAWIALLASAVTVGTLSQVPRHPAKGIQVSSVLNKGANPFSLLEVVENVGQYDKRVAYWSSGLLGDTYVLTDGRLVHAIPERSPRERESRQARRAWYVIETLQDGRSAAPVPASAESVPVTYLVPGGGGRTAASFTSLWLQDVWPGVDVQYKETPGGTERIFTVHPGSSVALIHVGLQGANAIWRDRNENLVLATGLGDIRYQSPTAFQTDRSGRSVILKSHYVPDSNGRGFRISVDNYDHSRPLIIDPILQGTYFGQGSAANDVSALAFDPATGDTLVSGVWASGGALPSYVTAGGFQSITGPTWAFIARLDSKLERAIHMTFLGGATGQLINDMAVDPGTGDVLVAGETGSPDFPGGGGSDEPVPANSVQDGSDGFISRLSGDLRTLHQTIFFGGSRDESLLIKIAISNSTGDVYAVGSSYNENAAWINRYDGQLTHVLSRVVFQGNSQTMRGLGLALNQQTGDVYISGDTQSWQLPAIAGGAFSSSDHDQTYPNPAIFIRGFIARYDSTLSTLYQSTYILDKKTFAGRQPWDRVPIAVDPATGDVLVADQTWGDLGPLANAAQGTFGGGPCDVLLARFSGDLRNLVGASYFGGSDQEFPERLALSPDGSRVYIAGVSTSPTLPMSSVAGISSFKGFAAVLSADLATLQSTYYAESNWTGDFLAMDVNPATGEVYLGGYTLGPSTFHTAGGFQANFDVGLCTAVDGCGDAFIMRLDAGLSPNPLLTPDPFSFPSLNGVPVSSVVTSAPVRVYGTTQDVPISIVTGQYSLDGGPFTTSDGSYSPGQMLQLQQQTSTSTGTQQQTVITVGGVSGTFLTTTQSGTNVTPVAFTFAPIDPIATSISAVSNSIVVTGIDTAAPISVTGGSYSIDGAAFTSAPGTVYAGQSVRVMQTTASGFAGQTDTVLTIGGGSATFSTVTDPMNSTPHAFAYHAVTWQNANQTLGAQAGGVITGINAPAPVSVTGGTVQILNPSYDTVPNGYAGDFSTVQPIVTAGGPGSVTSATVTVGGISVVYNVTVPDSSVPANGVPNPFTVPTVNDALPFEFVDSVPVTITGTSVPTPFEVVNPSPILILQIYDPAWGAYHRLNDGINADAYMFQPGQQLQLRMVVSGYGTQTVNFTLGGVPGSFTVNTISGTTPDPFTFADHLNVAAGSAITSETLTISGMHMATPASASGCQISINGQVPYVSQGAISAGQTLTLSIQAPSTAGSSAICSVTVGTYTDNVKITTMGSSTGGGGSSGGGGGGGSMGWVGLLVLAFGAAARCRSWLVGRRTETVGAGVDLYA